jgi:anti-sigma-K factor RskA
MSGDPIVETHDCSGDAAAYALGALDHSEAEAFRRHLNSCVVCRDEVAAFGHVIDALAMSAPKRPVPHGLRRRIMRDARIEPSSAVQPARRRLPGRLPGRVGARPAIAGGVLAAATLAIVGVLGVAPRGSEGTRLIQAAVTGMSGSAQLRVAGARAELIVTHLPAPVTGRIYEVWVTRGRQAPAPTRALFSVTRTGGADIGVPGDVRGVNTIMVTQEPAGGSLVPTGAPLIVAHLT